MVEISEFELPALECVICGNMFDRKGRRRKTCGHDCRDENARIQRRVGKRRQFLKYRHRNKARRRANQPPRKCVTCGILFNHGHCNQKTCSVQCRIERLQIIQRKWTSIYRPNPARNCVVCGALIGPNRGNSQTCRELCRVVRRKFFNGKRNEQITNAIQALRESGLLIGVMTSGRVTRYRIYIAAKKLGLTEKEKTNV